MMPKFYRKKPVVVQACEFQLTDESYKEMKKFLGNEIEDGSCVFIRGNTEILIPTLEGTMSAKPGDFIIQGVNGEKYPYRPDIFHKTYEIV